MKIKHKLGARISAMKLISKNFNGSFEGQYTELTSKQIMKMRYFTKVLKNY